MSIFLVLSGDFNINMNVQEEIARKTIETERLKTKIQGDAVDAQSAAAFLTGNQMQQKSQEIVKFLLDGNSIIQNIKMNLMGFMFNPSTNQFESIHEPQISKKAMGEILIHISSRINANSIMSVLDIDDAHRMTLDTVRPLIKEIASKGKEWKIPMHSWDRIVNLIDNNIFCLYTRAIGGRTLDNVTNNISHIEMQRSNSNQGPSGFSDLFSGKMWGKR